MVSPLGREHSDPYSPVRAYSGPWAPGRAQLGPHGPGPAHSGPKYCPADKMAGKRSFPQAICLPLTARLTECGLPFTETIKHSVYSGVAQVWRLLTAIWLGRLGPAGRPPRGRRPPAGRPSPAAAGERPRGPYGLIEPHGPEEPFWTQWTIRQSPIINT